MNSNKRQEIAGFYPNIFLSNFKSLIITIIDDIIVKRTLSVYSKLIICKITGHSGLSSAMAE